MHPLSLLLRFLGRLPNLAFPIVAIIFGTRGVDAGAGFVILGIAGFLLVSMFFSWLAWTRFRYTIRAEDILIESGIVNRNARSIPFERIQDVSIEQKLLARIFSLGEVKFETGSGEGEDAKLAYVSLNEGNRLRSVIRDRREGISGGAANAATAPADIGEEEDAQIIFAMPLRRVLTFGLFEFSLVIFAVLLGLAQQFEFLLPFDLFDLGAWTGLAQDSGVDLESIDRSARILGGITALLSLVLIGIATGVFRTLLREYGFILTRTAKGFRRQRGLTTRTDVVMPLHRVQAGIIESGFIRKRFGWHALKFVSLAQDSKEETSHAAAPFATLKEIEPIAMQANIMLTADDTALQRPARRWWFDKLLMRLPFMAIIVIASSLIPGGSAYAFLPAAVLPVMALLLWLDWRHQAYAYADGQMVHKRGWWRPRMTIAPELKIQSVEIRQGPIARLRGLALLEFGIAGGTLKIEGIPLQRAADIRRDTLAQICNVDFSQINRG